MVVLFLLFQLPDHSRIAKAGDINGRIKKFSDLSSRSGEALEEWVRTRPRTGGCITTFAEVREATKFFLQVGEGK